MKWICTVCNYVHNGDAPPDICPVCGAKSDVFEQTDETDEETVDEKKSTTEESSREWVCTVCKYVHKGDAPPDNCPVCSQPWSVFIPRVEEAPPAVGQPSDDAKEKGDAERWRCVICNYIHGDSEPPEVCPICGAGKKDFVPEKKSPEHHHRGWSGLVEKLHLHPVSAHMPNGALPLAFLSWIAYLVLAEACLERASFYLMLVSAAAVPFTALTGWSDARHRFGTTVTGVFPEKKRLSMVLGVVMWGMVIWRLFLGWHHVPQGTETLVFSVLLVGATGVAARLGMLGGKLVFGH